MVPDIPEDAMRQVMKKFAHTKWSELAAFHLLQNKMCGDWQGLPECPEKETQIYLKYATDHPDSPAFSEAMYDAAYRQAALVGSIQNQQRRAEVDRRRHCECQAIRAACHRQESTERLGVSLAYSDIHGGSENARVWERGSVNAYCGCPISPFVRRGLNAKSLEDV